MISFQTATIDTDVLIVGGGLAGCMAAIRSSELGAKTVLAEKGNTRRSGMAGAGIDHIWSYVPELHEPLGYTMEDMVRDQTEHAEGFLNQDVCLTAVRLVYDRVRDLERFGVPVRDENGNFRVLKRVHRVPSELHVAGRDMKVRLTEQVQGHSVPILNRVMITDLLVNDGRICGAVGVSTRKPLLYVFKAKAVVISTGGVQRLWKSTSGMPSNIAYPPHETGDGHAMCFRAGAEIYNMEYSPRHSGPKNLEKSGLGSWYAARPVNAFGEAPPGQYTWDPVYYRNMVLASPEWIEKQITQGKGPVYADHSGAPEETLQYQRWALENEGNLTLLFEQAGADFRGKKIEFEVYEPRSGRGHAGVGIDAKCAASLPGLFAAGDCVGGMFRSVSGGALALGWQAGESAADWARLTGPAHLGDQAAATASAVESRCEAIANRRIGASWQEAQLALQNIMDYYVGRPRTESMLEAGHVRLCLVREQIQNELSADSPHAMMRCLEVLNLLDAAEMVILSAKERRETRPAWGHIRADYPMKDDANWLRFLAVVRRDSGAEVVSRAIRYIL